MVPTTPLPEFRWLGAAPTQLDLEGEGSPHRVQPKVFSALVTSAATPGVGLGRTSSRTGSAQLALGPTALVQVQRPTVVTPRHLKALPRPSWDGFPAREHGAALTTNRSHHMESFLVYLIAMLLGCKYFIVPWFILVCSEGLTGHFNRAVVFLPLLLPLGPPLLIRGVLTWDTEEGPYARTMVIMALVWSSLRHQRGRKRATTALRPRQGAALRANGRWLRQATLGCPLNSADQRPGFAATLVFCMVRWRITLGTIKRTACSMAWRGPTCLRPS